MSRRTPHPETQQGKAVNAQRSRAAHRRQGHCTSYKNRRRSGAAHQTRPQSQRAARRIRGGHGAGPHNTRAQRRARTVQWAGGIDAGDEWKCRGALGSGRRWRVKQHVLSAERWAMCTSGVRGTRGATPRVWTPTTPPPPTNQLQVGRFGGLHAPKAKHWSITGSLYLPLPAL